MLVFYVFMRLLLNILPMRENATPWHASAYKRLTSLYFPIEHARHSYRGLPWYEMSNIIPYPVRNNGAVGVQVRVPQNGNERTMNLPSRKGELREPIDFCNIRSGVQDLLSARAAYMVEGGDVFPLRRDGEESYIRPLTFSELEADNEVVNFTNLRRRIAPHILDDKAPDIFISYYKSIVGVLSKTREHVMTLPDEAPFQEILANYLRWVMLDRWLWNRDKFTLHYTNIQDPSTYKVR